MSGIRNWGDIPKRFLGDDGDYFPVLVQTNAIGYLYFSGNVADTETITLPGRVFEFDSNSTYTAGNIPVDVSAGLTPAIATVALAAAINGDSFVGCSAKVIGTTVVALISDDTTALSIAEATANVSVSAALMTNGVAAADANIARGAYVVTAQDVTTFAASSLIPIGKAAFNGVPVNLSTHIETSTGQIVVPTDEKMVYAWTLLSGTEYMLVLTDPAGTADLTAGDIIYWSAIG